MLIRVTDFGGVAPRIDSRMLPDNMATQAINCKLWRRNLAAYYGPSRVRDLADQPITLFKSALTIQSLFRFDVQPGDPDGAGDFFHANGIANYARAPLPGDAEWATIISGDGLAPRIAYRSDQAGPDYPTAWDPLGIPVPDVSGVVATVQGDAEDGATAVNDGVNRNYLIAWVNDRGQLGPTSNPIVPNSVWLPGQTVELTGLPTVPGNGVTPQTKRIYRQSATGTTYFFVAEIPFSDTTYTDSVLEAQLGEAAVNTLYEAPPEDMTCIGVAQNGICYGASGADVCLSQPSLPHAWNPLARETLEYDIIAMGHFGNNIVAATGENPHVIYGNTPGAMVRRKVEINQGCLGKRSAVSGVFGFTYASRDGLVLINNLGNDIVTSAHFTRDEWRELNPASMNAALYADRYFAFIDGLADNAAIAESDREPVQQALAPLAAQQGGIIFDPNDAQRGLVMIDTYGTALYSDPIARGLYYVTPAGELWQWDNDLSTRLTYTWRSKVFVASHYAAIQYVRVLANSYDDLQIDIYRDGELQHTATVTSREPFPIPCDRKGREFQFVLRGTDTVTEAALASGPSEFHR